jgi:YhcH/YjgK/YiaL family protein
MCNLEIKTMRTFIAKIIMVATILNFSGCKESSNPDTWSSTKTDEWFNKGDWKNGWNVVPDGSINKKQMAVAYFNHRERWDSAFNFLKTSDLSALELKRYDLDGDKLYVAVSEYNTKNEQEAKYEVHRKYIDIQYVAKGKEMIGIAPLTAKDSVLQEYDPAKDIEFMTVNEERNVPADPDKFFVFFPEDVHRPGLKVDTIAPVRKIVVKVRID